jgi:hypothetical protein
MQRRWIQRKERAGQVAPTESRLPQGGAGQPLPDKTREKFERSTGADLSGVRVHGGSDSAAEARALSARAFTVGQDIHVGEGELSGPDGESLLAHEVAHTVQQARSGAGAAQLKSKVSQPGEPLETEADAAAEAMVSGSPAQISSGGGQIMRSAMPHAEQERQGVAPAESGAGEHQARPQPLFGDNLHAAIHSLTTDMLIASLGSLASSTVPEAAQVRTMVAAELGSRLEDMDQNYLIMLQTMLANDGTPAGRMLCNAAAAVIHGRMEAGRAPSIGADDGRGRPPTALEAAGEDPQITALRNLETGGPLTLWNNTRLILRGGSHVELVKDINEEHEMTASIDELLAEGMGPEAVEHREAQDEVGEMDTTAHHGPEAQHGNDTHDLGTTGASSSAPRQQRRAAERSRSKGP